METITPNKHLDAYVNVNASSAESYFLSFIDMAVALDKPQVDHTYASHKGSNVRLSGEKCVFQERDHSYSLTRKHSKKSKISQSLKEKEVNVSSKVLEQNLPVNSLSVKDSSCIHEDNKTREKNRSAEFENKNYRNPIALSSSWPKESNFITSFSVGKKDGTDSTDHTYARETQTLKQQEYFHTKTSQNMPSPENSNFELLSKLSITSDHAYTDKHSDCSSLATKTQNKSLARFDHSYVHKHSIPNFVEQNYESTITRLDLVKPIMSESQKDHNYSGSCESLELDFSASDTDSCEETNETVTKLAFKAWCQLRKDHPYSSF